MSLNYPHMFFVIIILLPVSVSASVNTLSSVEVDTISVSTGDGLMYVSFSSALDISGLSCTNSNSLILDVSKPGYQATLSLLLSAQARGVKVKVKVNDDDGTAGTYCRLSRIYLGQ